MESNFIGQWTGTSESGTFVLVNMAHEQDIVSGRVSTYEAVEINKEVIPYWTWSYFEGHQNGEVVEGNVSSPSIHHRYGDLMTDQELDTFKAESETDFPSKTTFTCTKSGNYNLEVKWRSIYPSGEIFEDIAQLSRERLGGSKIAHEPMSWNRFKEYALEQKDGLIYRGQSRHWRLQTSFHRTGHADLIAYLDEKVPQVEHHINAFSDHVYDIKNDRYLGALLNLAQHHGYPTPLLDWSKSPYVAAFFAFQDKVALKKDGSVSLFIFDERKWSRLSGTTAALRVPNMVVRALELPGFGNSRVLPQQAVTMYSNINDIESVITTNEKQSSKFLTAVSIPASDREVAMRDLSLMGITWGSMFPGLDGACKQLKARHFE